MSKKVDEYIKLNGLENSFIDKRILYQYRPTLPEIKIVASTSDFIVMFEETHGSLRNRHYNYKNQNKPSSYNLLFIDDKNKKDGNINVRLFTYDDLNKIKDLKLMNGYTDIDIERFLNTDNKRKNGLSYKKTGRKQVLFYVTDEEKRILKEFLEKLRNSEKITETESITKVE